MRILDYGGVEWALYNYRQFKARLENAQKTKKYIEDTESGVGAISYDGVHTGKTNAISSPVENAAMTREKMLKSLTAEIQELEVLIHRTDVSFHALPEREQCILRAYYIERRSWQEISEKNNYSVSWCKKMRKKSIEEMTKTINA